MALSVEQDVGVGQFAPALGREGEEGAGAALDVDPAVGAGGAGIVAELVQLLLARHHGIGEILQHPGPLVKGHGSERGPAEWSALPLSHEPLPLGRLPLHPEHISRLDPDAERSTLNNIDGRRPGVPLEAPQLGGAGEAADNQAAERGEDEPRSLRWARKGFPWLLKRTPMGAAASQGHMRVVATLPLAPATGITVWLFPEWFVGQDARRAADGHPPRPARSPR